MSLFHEPADLDAARVARDERFPGRRLVEVVYHDPITGDQLAALLVAALNYDDAIAWWDARGRGSRWSMITDRILFPALPALADLRAEWPGFSITVEEVYRKLMGFSGDVWPVCRPLTAATAPPGLAADDARALLAANQGSRLWSVSLAENGLALVWRQPTTEQWQLAARLAAEASAKGVGELCPALATFGDHCVWTPDGSLRQHVDASPGRAADLGAAWNAIGGLAARATARFL